MISGTCAFLAGVLALQYLPELPPWYCYTGVLAAPLALRWCPVWLPAVFLIGFFWAAYHAQRTLDAVLDASLESRTVLVQGSVADLPVKKPQRGVRFLFHADRLDAGNGWNKFARKFRLSWYQTQEIPALGSALATGGAVETSSWQRQSGRLRLRTLAVPAAHFGNRLCAGRQAQPPARRPVRDIHG